MRTIESDIWGKVTLRGRGDGVVGMPIAEGVGPSWPFMLALSSPVVVVSDLFLELEDGILSLLIYSTESLSGLILALNQGSWIKLLGKQLAYARRFHQMTSVPNGLLRSAADGISDFEERSTRNSQG